MPSFSQQLTPDLLAPESAELPTSCPALTSGVPGRAGSGESAASLSSPTSPPCFSFAGQDLESFTAEPAEPTKPIMGIGLAEATPGLPGGHCVAWVGGTAAIRRTLRTGPELTERDLSPSLAPPVGLFLTLGFFPLSLSATAPLTPSHTAEEGFVKITPKATCSKDPRGLQLGLWAPVTVTDAW